MDSLASEVRSPKDRPAGHLSTRDRCGEIATRLRSPILSVTPIYPGTEHVDRSSRHTLLHLGLVGETVHRSCGVGKLRPPGGLFDQAHLSIFEAVSRSNPASHGGTSVLYAQSRGRPFPFLDGVSEEPSDWFRDRDPEF